MTAHVLEARKAPGVVFFCINFLALLYVVPFSSLMLFFGVSAVLVKGKELVDAREQGAYLGLAILVLLLLLSFYHSGSVVIGTKSPVGWYLEKAAPSLLESLRAFNGLSGIGVSYCFLRTVYALLQPKLDLWGFVRYYFFLPTFFSGPILRTDEYLSQTPAYMRSNVAPALARVTLGAIKVLASQLIQGFLPLASEPAMIEKIQTPSFLGVWGFAFSAGIWLYLNFSGFSDMCIGFAKLFNVTVPENFNNPFAARDITDFWRRWHMTLATWLRTCIYTPVARGLGNRLGQQHLALHILPPLVTMAVCGLWHGVSLGYIIWGGMHGAGLVIHQGWKLAVAPKLSPGFRATPAYNALAWLITHAYISLAWVFFFPSPTPSLRLSLLYLTRMFGLVSYEIDMAITNFAAHVPL